MSIQVKLSIHDLRFTASALVHRLKVYHIREVVLLPNQSTHLDKYLVLTESYTETQAGWPLLQQQEMLNSARNVNEQDLYYRKTGILTVTKYIR